MSSLLCSLILASTLTSVKAEMVGKYPAFEKQINQVGAPTVGYKSRMPFHWRRLAFIKGKCDPFASPQIMVVKAGKIHVTVHRLRHELSHFVAFAAALPDKEHERIEKLQAALKDTEKQRDEFAQIVSCNRWPDTAAKLLRKAKNRAEAAESEASRAKAVADMGSKAFITCNSRSGNYSVSAKFQTLEDAQEFHEAIICLIRAFASQSGPADPAAGGKKQV